MGNPLPPRLESFIGPLVTMCRSQFPRACSTCGHQFEDFSQWVGRTDPIGVPTLNGETEADPFGMLSWVNCRCGSTLVLECMDTSGAMHEQFMQALTEESELAGRSVRELLLDLRAEVRRRSAAAGP